MLIAPWGGGSGEAEIAGLDTGASNSTVANAHGTPGTDGAWTQLIASTKRRYHGIWFQMGTSGTATGWILAQFGIGAGGSERALFTIPITNRAASFRNGVWGGFLPFSIPGGVRLALRAHRSTTASVSVRGSITGIMGPSRYLPPFHRITDYGIVLASVRGTSVDPGATANTQGSRVQIVASTANPIKALFLLCMRRDEAIVGSNISSTCQLFLGAAGPALTPEIPQWTMNGTADHDNHFGPCGPFFVNLPAGVDIRAACRCSGNTAGERESQVMLWGLD